MKTKHSNIPIFIPELACPHQCVFCNQANISSRTDIPEPNEIHKIIDEHLSTMDDGRIINIAFFGGSFTGISFDLQKEYLNAAYEYVKSGRVDGIRLSTRPDYINEPILNLLKENGVQVIELGAQSTDDYVLQKSGRGHLYKDIVDAAKMIKGYDFELGLQMMLGLPHDTLEKSLNTANQIIELGANNTRIYPTLVVKDTALEKLYNEGKYKPLDLESAVEWSKQCLMLFEKNNVKVLRVGLHPSEELNYGKALIAGPYHPSFNEMVMTSIWKDILEKEITPHEKKDITLTVSSSQFNYAVGYKGKNRDWLNSLGFQIKFIRSKKLEKYEINISNN